MLLSDEHMLMDILFLYCVDDDDDMSGASTVQF